MAKEQNIFMRFVNYLKEKKKFGAARFFYTLFFKTRTIITGLIAMLRLAFGMLLGKKKHFNFYGLNPTELTKEQASHPPLLLLHGNYTNQSNWLSWARKLRKDYPGPVFSVNLHNGNWTNKDRAIINDKLDSMKALYKEHGLDNVKTHLVGHSRGGTLAFYNSLQDDMWQIDDDKGNISSNHYYRDLKFRADIGQVIMIGSCTFNHSSFANITNKLHSVISTNDYYFTFDDNDFNTARNNTQDLVVDDPTHTGLILDNNVYRHVLKWIKNADPQQAAPGGNLSPRLQESINVRN